MKILKIFLSILLISFLCNNTQAQQTEPVLWPEKLPEFPGGEVELQKFISKNMIYPKEAKEKKVEEKVIVYFIIELDGTISNINLLNINYSYGFGDEAMRIVSLMPKWIPGQIDEKNVRTKWNILVNFSLDNAANFNKQTKNIEENEYFSKNITNGSKDKTSSYTQLNRFYSVGLSGHFSSKKESTYNLYFSLCKDGNYDIHLERSPLGDVIIGGYTLSIGKYVVKNNTIFLTDSYTRCKMSFQLGSSSLKPLKTFPFMQEIAFKDYFVCARSEPFYKMKETTAEKLVSDFETKNIQNNPFKEGLYKCKFYGDEWFYIILKDESNNYELGFKTLGEFPYSNKLDICLTISTGTWERKGNILTLWDTNLQHTFYGLIRKDGSIELLFFRWMEDMVFKKTN